MHFFSGLACTYSILQVFVELARFARSIQIEMKSVMICMNLPLAVSSTAD